MRRVTGTVIAAGLTAVAVAAVGAGSGAGSGAGGSGTATPEQANHRGGTLKLLARAAGGTIDPHVNYTLQYWQLYQATYDGLVAFRKAGGDAAFQVVPDLAEKMPTPTNGGKTLGVQDSERDQVLERQGA